MTDSPAERTRLARLRTAAGFAVLTIFLLRQGLAHGTSRDVAAALLALSCAVGCAAPVPARTQGRSTVLRIRLLALAVVAMSCLALAGALASRS
jgi:hypothetical protein